METKMLTLNEAKAKWENERGYEQTVAQQLWADNREKYYKEFQRLFEKACRENMPTFRLPHTNFCSGRNDAIKELVTEMALSEIKSNGFKLNGNSVWGWHTTSELGDDGERPEQSPSSED